MTILLPAFGLVFATLCIWLGVRICNRRERWAEWTLAAIIGVPTLYIVSIGPACWASSRFGGEVLVSLIYQPAIEASTIVSPGIIMDYCHFGASPAWVWESRSQDGRSKWKWKLFSDAW